jgi:O-antigen/teichoic acid export membrane protein
MLAGVASVPVLLGGLGREGFGVWALVMTFSATNGWLSLADLGAVVATTRRVAAWMAVEDRRAARRTIGAGMVVALGAGTVGAVLLVLSSRFLPALFHTPAHLVTPFRQALVLMAVQVVVDQLINVMEAGLEGLQRVDVSRGVDMARRLLVLGCAAATAWQTHDLARVAAASLAATIVSAVIAYLVLRSYLLHAVERPRRSEVVDIVRVGREIAVLRPLGVVQRTLDRLLVGAVLGPAAVALVEVATQLMAGAEAVLSASAYSVVPAASWLQARGDRKSLAELVRKGTRWSLVVTVPVAVLIGVFAGPFVRIWIGEGYERVAPLAAVACLCVVVNAPLAVGSQMLVGIGKTRIVLRSAAVCLVVNLVVSVVMLEAVGTVGVFVGTLVANVALLVVMGPAVLAEVRDGDSGDVQHALERNARPL